MDDDLGGLRLAGLDGDGFEDVLEAGPAPEGFGVRVAATVVEFAGCACY